MRFLSADWIFPLHIPPVKKGVIEIDSSGYILGLYNNRNEVKPNKIEIYEGYLCPGFVNAHCHLELSHLSNYIKPDKGFINFAKSIKKRNIFSEEKIERSIRLAEDEMKKNGIVAVGDICNTLDTLTQKKKRNLLYYNFIEVFSVKEQYNKDVISSALYMRNKFRDANMKASIVPHAPYSVNPNLLKNVINISDSDNDIITIHIDESFEEKKLFSLKDGEFIDWLKSMEADPLIWEDRSTSSSIIKDFNTHKILSVHNTFSDKSDMGDIYYCTCPRSNIYIENTLPDYSIFNTEKLCVGTDSLSSNFSLSIYEEIMLIKENSNFDLNTLLKISSKNGAEALGFSELGTLESGKKPGINLINKSVVNRIV